MIYPLVVALMLFISTSDCARIIALLPVASKSHKQVFRPLVEGLASRGHQVTFVSPYEDKTVPENVKEIVITSNYEMMKEFTKTFLEKSLKDNQQVGLDFNFTYQGIDNFYEDPNMLQLFNAGKQFDLAIVSSFMNEAALTAAYTLADKVVMLGVSGVVPPGPTAPPFPLGTMKMIESSFLKKYEFLSRIVNVITLIGIWNIYSFFTFSYIEKSSEKHGFSFPTVDEAFRDIALILINADPVMIDASPGLPNVVHVGGMHCKPPKELPKEFSDFIDSSNEDGFILFSLGSVMQGMYLPKETQKEFLKAFSRLKQKVIWKFEEQMDDLPSNVMVTPWTPQQDILGHPKIRLFITHGGLLSMQETLYHGVPVIGIPIYADQPMNVKRMVELGIGESMELSNVTAEAIYSTIQKIVNTPKYSIEMKRESIILRDQIETPLERGIFWLEYLLRHKGADFLHSSAENLDYYQYFCVDILTVIISFFSLLSFVFIKAIKAFKK